MIDWKQAQSRLGVTADGIAGPVTYTALMARVAGRTPLSGLADGIAQRSMSYAIAFNPERLAGFLGQTCHESGGFRLVREIWGPTPAQYGYEGRRDLGNTQINDGFRFRGRGLIQITGRANYAAAGDDLGLDLIHHPEIAETPDGAVLVALWYWGKRNLNASCDAKDWRGLTRRINGGFNGLDERLRYITRALAVLS